MSQELDQVIKETQLVLGEIFTKPKLTKKLLTRPPFRYIHDIFTAILQETGFPFGLFNDEELNSDNFKSKETKVRFLRELITLVGICKGMPVDVDPVMIVAGLNADKTNKFLTYLGEVARDTSIDRKVAVQLCLAGEIPGKCECPLIKSLESTNDKRMLPTTSTALTSDLGTNLVSCIPALAELSTSERTSLCNSNREQTISWVTLLGVTKPKCTNKLLSRPPFRFLHDLFLAVAKRTDFQLTGLTDEEFISTSLQDKPSKVTFLEKIVLLVSKTIRKPVDIKPSKIVAGLEVDNTIHFIQLFIVAALDDLGDNIDGRSIASKSSSASEIDMSKNEISRSTILSDEIEQKLTQVKNKDNVLTSHHEVGTECSVKEFEGLSLSECIKQCNDEIVQTQSFIEQIIQRPKCTEKLMSRPPFRFLRDVIVAIVLKTDFCVDTILNDENMSDNPDKDTKIAFLEKVIACISLYLDGYEVEASPAKIVAGLEPGLTCKLLQILVAVSISNRKEKIDDISAVVPDEEKVKEKVDSSLENSFQINKTNDFNTYTFEEKCVDTEITAAPIDASLETKVVSSPGRDSMGNDIVENEPEVVQVDEETYQTMNIEFDNHLQYDNNKSEVVGSICDHDEDHPQLEAENVINIDKIVRPMTARRRPPRSRPKTAASHSDDMNKVDVEREIFYDGEIIDDDLVHNESPSNDDFACSKTTMEETKQQSPTKQGVRLQLHSRKKPTSSLSTLPCEKLAKVDPKTLIGTLQALVQSTSPLGKQMDSIERDLEKIINEREASYSSFLRLSYTLEERKDEVKTKLIPLRQKVISLQNEIKKERMRSHGLQLAIARNDQYIERIVHAVVQADQ